MKCSGCDKPLANGVTVCLHCGTPIPHRSDVPVGAGAFAAMPDPVLPSGGHWDITSIPASPYDTLTPLSPPPPPPSDLYANGAPPYPHTTSKQPLRRWQTALATLLLLALVLGGVGISYAAGAIPPINAWGKNTNSPAGATAARCALPTVDHAVATLSDVQMTSKLGTSYAPTDSTTTFAVGQTVYVTFKIATNDPGTLVATWCLENANETAPSYTESVKANEKQVAGYVSLTNLDANAIGLCSVVLTWNKTVVAALAFTVKR